MKIHTHDIGLPHDVWFIPNNKRLVYMNITFKDAGYKNVSHATPACLSLGHTSFAGGVRRQKAGAFSTAKRMFRPGWSMIIYPVVSGVQHSIGLKPLTSC